MFYYSVIETEDDGDKSSMRSVIEKPAELTCEDIINQIRRDEFGVGVHLNEDGERLMKVMCIDYSISELLFFFTGTFNLDI